MDFQHLPREVVKHTKEDFDTICGAMAAQLAALFAFLKPGQETLLGKDGEDLALYADPTYWLYGLLSFCAKSCEAKTTETGGEPDFKTSKERKQESTARCCHAQFTRSHADGCHEACKSELLMDHAHIHFPVQIVRKVTAQCGTKSWDKLHSMPANDTNTMQTQRGQCCKQPPCHRWSL